MRKVTISIADDIYAALVDFVANTSKEDLTRLSISKALREILVNQLGQLKYYPPTANEKQDKIREYIEEGRG
jgi:hypothetical protein